MDPISKIETQVEEAAVQAGGFLRSRFGLWVLAGISFVESALPVPVVTDPFLIAYILANKAAVIRAVVVTTLSSLVGGLFAYAIAFLFFEFIVAQYLSGGVEVQFYEIIEKFNHGVFWVTLAGAVTPIPYTLVALGAGFMKANVFIFILATLVGRGARYVLVGFLTNRFGEQALALVRRHLLFVTIAFFVAAGVYVLLSK